MREIEFRGKRSDNGEWVYGNYVKTVLGKRIFNRGIFYHIIPETIGQYTGCKDTAKDESKIYEHDILSYYCMDCGKRHETIVQWYKSGFVVTVCGESQYAKLDWLFESDYVRDPVVIGNASAVQAGIVMISGYD